MTKTKEKRRQIKAKKLQIQREAKQALRYDKYLLLALMIEGWYYITNIISPMDLSRDKNHKIHENAIRFTDDRLDGYIISESKEYPVDKILEKGVRPTKPYHKLIELYYNNLKEKTKGIKIDVFSEEVSKSPLYKDSKKLIKDLQYLQDNKVFHLNEIGYIWPYKKLKKFRREHDISYMPKIKFKDIL